MRRREFVYIPGTDLPVEAVSGRSKTYVWMAGPVGAVVDGFAAGEGPVGDFVMDISGRPEDIAEQAVLCRALLLGGLFVAAFADHPAQRAAFLDAQLIS